jgi:RNA polymerase sigma factor (TIGR02999 family)
LVGSETAPQWDHRGHFFAAAAEAMRRILVDNARRKRALKRGGPTAARQEFDADRIALPEPADDLAALSESLDRFAAKEPQKAELVKLRYFAGMTLAEAGELLGISRSTADAWWRYSRAWLHRDLSDARTTGEPPKKSPGESGASDSISA